MAILHSIGDRLLTTENIATITQTGLLSRLFDPQDSLNSIDIDGVPLSIESATRAYVPPSGIPTTQIAYGKPLSIEMLNTYTGDFPHLPPGIGKADLLVTSAIRPNHGKSSAKAANLLKSNVERRQNHQLSASENGTNLLFHTPALTESQLIVSIDLMVARIGEDAFDQLSNILKSAAQFPVFIPASAYLLAGSLVTKLVGSLVNLIYKKGPWLTDTETLYIDRPGAQASYGPIVFCRTADQNILQKLRINPKGFLIHPADQKIYDGPCPYVSAYLDSTHRPEYADFQAAAASADLLAEFYDFQGNNSAPAGILLDALKLYNDMDARSRIEAIDKLLPHLDLQSEEYKKQMLLRAGWIKKIQNDLLKPANT